MRSNKNHTLIFCTATQAKTVFPSPVRLILSGINAGVIVVIVLFALWIIYVVRTLVENKPGAIPRCVGMMIAAISLVDMLMVVSVVGAVAENLGSGIATTGVGTNLWAWSAFCLLCFGATLVLQRFVPGT